MSKEAVMLLGVVVFLALVGILAWEYWLSGVYVDVICGYDRNAYGC